MATTRQHINARNDPDLLDRFIAAAEQEGIEDASAWVQANMGNLVNSVVQEGQTISDVHAYADETRNAYMEATPPRPGFNLSAVTDANLITALNVNRNQEEPEDPEDPQIEG